ncbi:hypothetical protein PFICI_01987 [Pestalotiopsis fici W106-1]|uniref:Uncharacterized protein n=1 Tax=Pestalotiopsis fici (strain W106-1 / CGMCC3.15140) TaxID=1229662 RepID=W3XQ93_PESFW|nr:uncharacterized protein PFICI_01987 [Pestalotiopsis fici W106-1]ETS88159.1 hypothetical protein PFICI_01987 [Pestalotiopsis fici W106-1]
MFSSKNCVLLALTLVSSQADAICTNFTDTTFSADTGGSYQTGNGVYVNSLACPSSEKQSCSMANVTSYDITVPRKLLHSGDPLGLSEEESDAIFEMAKDAYNDAYYSNSSNNHFKNASFETIQTRVDFDGQDPANSIFSTVEPGTNKTLIWGGLYQYAAGTLGGCTNDTLNNMRVVAQGPYYTTDKNNRTVVAGSWQASWHNITESMAASTFRASSISTYSTATLALMVGMTLVL